MINTYSKKKGRSQIIKLYNSRKKDKLSPKLAEGRNNKGRADINARETKKKKDE